MKGFARYIAITILLCTNAFMASAQFKEDAFSQSYSTADTLGRDTTETMFSFKEYFGGIRHTRNARVGVMLGGSTVFIGGQQMHNREYWKLPVIYGGIGTTAGLGFYYRSQWNKTGKESYKTTSNLLFAGAGLIYWGSLLDGVANFPTDNPHHPGKATLFSLLLPGLGQAYNGEYWKIPVYYTCILGAGHFLMTNNTDYQRFKRIHNQATSPDIEYDGPISAETALYYRDVYRRYRDYSIVALAGFYLLQVIDANVFSYMQDFEIGDDLTMSIDPTVISPDNAYAFAGNGTGVGLRLGFTF